MATIYMPLLEEGTDVWRPVEATPVHAGVYRVEGPMPAQEEWAFAPGALVDVRWKTLGDGEQKLVPIRNAYPGARYRLTKWAIILGATIVSVLPFTTELDWIYFPSPFGKLYFAFLAVVATMTYLRWRKMQVARKTAGPLALMFTVVALASLFA